MADEIKKVCKGCQLPKLLDEFYKNRNGVHGRDPYCKECKNAKSTQWAKDHPEDVARIKKKHYDANSDYWRNWREENREGAREASRRHRDSHLEQERERSNDWNKNNRDWYKEWRKANPEKMRTYARNDAIKNPAGYFARLAVRLAVLSGELPPVKTLQCVNCEEPAVDYHHHRGYAQEHWLDVIPVCRLCHKKLERSS